MNKYSVEQYIKFFKPEQLENINSYVKVKEWPRNREIVAMDMGGTNFRIGRVKFDNDGKTSIDDFKKFTMPGVEEEITADEFFTFFESMKAEYSTENVALCFSYSAQILPDMRARINTFSKNIKISGAEGRILNAAVVNDTIAALVGTRAANMSMILGTGFNLAYSKDGIIYNSECGRYVGFPCEAFDIGNMAENQVSGAFINTLIEENPDKRSLIIDRAARIVTAEIAGIAEYAGIYDLKIAAEGSVFHKFDELRERIIYHMDCLGLNYEFLDGRDTTLIGAAVAALQPTY